MIEEGADIVDIGAVSSRPGSDKVSAKEEMLRVKPIIDVIYEQKLYQHVKFSLDSYEPSVLEYALDHGFSIVNDITGLENDKVAKLASKYSATVVIMHMQKSPKDMQVNPHYENLLTDIEEFFKDRVEKAESFGVNDIVLDVGIGFGKTLDHNLQLIKHLSHFQKFNLPILIGASRKSMIDMIIPTPIEDRLSGTLVLHLKAVEEGASIVRCHDVKEHVQALKVFEALRSTTL
jgi:dihydropteroate synthase